MVALPRTFRNQETVAVNGLNLKMFLFCNEGYASIRMTQKNYFDGAYLGVMLIRDWVSRIGPLCICISNTKFTVNG